MSFSDSSTAWVGVIGAAVGGGLAFGAAWMQTRTTRSEGKVDRDSRLALERERFLMERRADAYVRLFEHLNHEIVMMHWDLRLLGIEVHGPEQPPPPEPPEVWRAMVGRIRAFASAPVRGAFLRLHELHRLSRNLMESDHVNATLRTDTFSPEEVTKLEAWMAEAEQLARFLELIMTNELSLAAEDTADVIAPGFLRRLSRRLHLGRAEPTETGSERGSTGAP